MKSEQQQICFVPPSVTQAELPETLGKWPLHL